MEIDAAVGFLSYAHSDDEADEGRIVRLARKLEREYKMITGQTLTIFVDRDDIRWGQEWKARIDGALQNTTFFIPVLTEAFFQSDECRREFLEFYNTAKNLGVSQYLLAIRYAAVKGLDAESPIEAKVIAAKTQFKDWAELRLMDEASSEHRKAVNNLAEELRDLMEIVEATPAQTAEEISSGEVIPKKAEGVVSGADAPLQPPTKQEPSFDDPYSDDPSPMDLMAEFQPRSEAWIATMGELPKLVEDFLAPINAAGAEIAAADAAGKPYATRIVILRRVAAELEAPSIAVEEHGKRYTKGLLDLDAPIRAMFELARNADVTKPGELEAVEKVANSIVQMGEAAKTTREQVSVAIESGRTLARMSRDLRPALRRYESGTRNIVDGQSVIDDWVRLAEDTAEDARARADKGNSVAK